MTLLYEAAYDGNLEDVQGLLDNYHDPNKTTSTPFGDETPFAAVIHGRRYAEYLAEDEKVEARLAIMALLLERGADIRLACNIHKRAPLHWAAFYNFPDFVFFLLKNKEPESELVLQRPRPYIDMINPFVDERDFSENTPLHLLTHMGELGFCKGHCHTAYLLLKAGANLFAVNSANRSAAEYLFESEKFKFINNKNDYAKFNFENKQLTPASMRYLFNILAKQVPQHDINEAFLFFDCALRPLTIKNSSNMKTHVPKELKEVILRNTSFFKFNEDSRSSNDELNTKNSKLNF